MSGRRGVTGGGTLAWAIASVVSLGCGSSASAQLPPGLHVTLGLNAQHDSNLLRLPDGVAPSAFGLDTEARDDLLLAPTVQVDGVLGWARQRLTLHAGGRALRYRTNDNFDTQITDWRGTWHWALAGDWSGELSGSREEQATSFEDFVGTQRNVLAVRSVRAGAHWRPRPDRRVSAYFDGYRGENSEAARRANDYRIKLGRLDVLLASAHGNEVAIGARYTDGNYPNREIFALAPVDNSYRQYEADLSLVYNPGGHTRLDLRSGYAWRRHEQVPERDFSAPVGRFAIHWQAGGKLTLDAEAARDVAAVEDFDRIYAVTTAARGGLSYRLTSKTVLSSGVRRRKIVYRGDPANVLAQFSTQAAREDTLDDRTLGFTWTPDERWQVEASYQHLKRRSNRPQLQYRARVVQLTSQYRW